MTEYHDYHKLISKTIRVAIDVHKELQQLATDRKISIGKLVAEMLHLYKEVNLDPNKGKTL